MADCEDRPDGHGEAPLIILHPFTTYEQGRKIETWQFVQRLQKEGYEVLNRCIDPPSAYYELLKELWGKDDLIILEDDKVPMMEDFKELLACRYAYCIFPYPVSFYFYTPMSVWKDRFPYGLGFVKFSKVAQLNVPPESWSPHNPSRPWGGWGLDRRIEEPLIQKSGPMHLHSRMIKHNHHRALRAHLGYIRDKVLR